MQHRAIPLVNDNYYHVFSRSIAGYEVFNDNADYNRIYELISLYSYADFSYKYSRFNKLPKQIQEEYISSVRSSKNKIVNIVAYCIMPTHIHLLLKQAKDTGISKYMGRILNGYTRYFNIKHGRQGPLWAGRFKSVYIDNDEQLLHLTRYIHLNPTSAGLVENPEDWDCSSLSDYIGSSNKKGICETEGLFNMGSDEYRKFVMDRKGYQRQLSIIKSHLIDNYTG